MTRKAIMIGSPGSKNSATYLKGVDTDLHNRGHQLERQMMFFDNTTWFELMDFDTSIYYSTIDECKKVIKKLNL